jgi:hypothetical protein
LGFASQREGTGFRGLQRARKIRLALGGSANLFEAFPPRPAGMRHRTYARLRATYEAAEVRLGLR